MLETRECDSCLAVKPGCRWLGGEEGGNICLDCVPASGAWGTTKSGVTFHSPGLGLMGDESRAALERIVDVAAQDLVEKEATAPWPVLTLEFNNALHHYQDMDPDDGFEHDSTQYRQYFPAGHPAVLTAAEACLLAMPRHSMTTAEYQAWGLLRNRLSEFEKGDL